MTPGTIHTRISRSVTPCWWRSWPRISPAARRPAKCGGTSPRRELARLVVAAFDGLQLQWLYDKSVDMADGLTQLVDVLLAPPAA